MDPGNRNENKDNYLTLTQSSELYTQTVQDSHCKARNLKNNNVEISTKKHSETCFQVIHLELHE